jgi:hypothetical protein
MEFSVMRVPAALLLSILLLAAADAPAQDLLHRMRTTVTMPSQPGTRATGESAMYIKGSKIRANSNTGGVDGSVIVDAAAGKLYALSHSDRTYREMSTDFAADSSLMKGDTARMRMLGMIPEVIKTSEKKTILGYETVRVVTIARNPTGDANAGTVVISDSWISRDPALMKAFNASMQVAQRMMGGAAQQVMSLVPPEAVGVPLASTTLMLRRDAKTPIDALAILRQPSPEGLMMRMDMEPIEVKVVALPDSLFSVPAGYRKADN